MYVRIYRTGKVHANCDKKGLDDVNDVIGTNSFVPKHDISHGNYESERQNRKK